MKKETFYCDRCEVELPGRESNTADLNVDVTLGEYRIKITITKRGMVTELCRECRTKIISDAILEKDRYALVTSYDGGSA